MTILSYAPIGLEAIDSNGPRILFAEHHRQLRRAGTELMCIAHEDDCFALVAAFRNLEQQLREHMRAEEELVLPAYTEAFPEDATAVRDAHAAIRKQLDQTALDIELHAVRLVSIRALLALLDEHAKAEDLRMYPWAQVHLPITTRSTIGARMIESIRMLAAR